GSPGSDRRRPRSSWPPLDGGDHLLERAQRWSTPGPPAFGNRRGVRGAERAQSRPEDRLEVAPAADAEAQIVTQPKEPIVERRVRTRRWRRVERRGGIAF